MKGFKSKHQRLNLNSSVYKNIYISDSEKTLILEKEDQTIIYNGDFKGKFNPSYTIGTLDIVKLLSKYRVKNKSWLNIFSNISHVKSYNVEMPG
ncbi:hypothetical protein [Flammeovirga yaeyamensis]|nr:hypothetical protein [Flammeovirga yaeyamensis]